MPEEFKPGCQRPVIKKPKSEAAATDVLTEKKEVVSNMVKVGKPAPDFTASAFHENKFMNISLSEFKGKWVLLCFYPGDFTFV